MGRADEGRTRHRGGHHAAPKRRRPRPAQAATAAPAGGRPPKGRIRRLFSWKKILGTFFGFALLVIGALVALYMKIDIPAGNASAQMQSNIYNYSDGTLLTRTGELNRESVDLAQVPKDVQHAFVGAENKTFYQDAGVDLKGTARGVFNTLMGRGKQGGSTITQQYVKNYYLDQNQTVSRKLKELVISLKVDRQKSKDYILAGYINTSYYGRGAYGIQAAAQAYYHKDAKNLTVQEGAYLAALLQAPNQYDWNIASDTGKQLVKTRWNYVLDNMVEQHWLNSAERQGMHFPVPVTPEAAPGMKGQIGYLVDAANSVLYKQLVSQGSVSTLGDAEALVKKGGWTITLNIDRRKQTLLERAVKQQLTNKLDEEKRSVDRDVQPGAVSVDPATGQVVALYGGVDYFKHFTNNATRRDYQPASTFKPVILAAAMNEGAKSQDGQEITPNTTYDGTSGRQVVDNGVKVGFGPPNEDDHDYGKITVQTAMNQSVNSVFAQMGVDVGMDKVMATASRLGMDTAGMDAVPAQALGSMGASPLEMAGIYATLDNHGKKVTPAIIRSAEHRDQTLSLPDPIGDRVISQTAADTVTSVLTGVVDDGTARQSVANDPARDGQQVAGKTGTSDNDKSAWFTGYTPGLVTSVGLFGEDPKTHAHVPLTGATGLIPGTGRINGGGYPAKIWAAYTFEAMSGVSKFDVDTTPGATAQPSDTPSSSLTPSNTPTQTPSPSPTPSPSSSPTQAPSPSPSPSSSPTPTLSPTQTPSPTPTQTPTQTRGITSENPARSGRRPAPQQPVHALGLSAAAGWLGE
ncbi:transglycosylase domain-containing protein [Streptomyces griseorubiginosus]|uniref:transglycosylase domain-containing protein n=1 Tax=Streptomyces griseorubiginosus TaxID=67304 RepID=UPI0036E8DCEA